MDKSLARGVLHRVVNLHPRFRRFLLRIVFPDRDVLPKLTLDLADVVRAALAASPLTAVSAAGSSATNSLSAPAGSERA